MRLTNLLAHFGEYGFSSDTPLLDPQVEAVTADSRQSAPGVIFVAVSGGTTDGHLYIPDAIERGAAAVVGTETLTNLSVPYLRVSDSRLALAVIAAGLNDFPARRLTVIGVTGTDGKTTTANLIYHILRAAGHKTGMISTVNALIGDEVLDTGFHVTTPDAPAIQGYLKKMVAAGQTHVILEATSHGLSQSRVAACSFDLGVVTNITHEHLDYHVSFADYRAAKARLFEELGRGPQKEHHPVQAAVLNLDDASYPDLAAVTRVPILSYGWNSGDVHVDAMRNAVGSMDEPLSQAGPLGGISFPIGGIDLDGTSFRLQADTRLTGDFNIYNLLAAVALARGALRLPDDAVRLGLAEMPGVPGRMEQIILGQEFDAIVDFAHTPNALRRALEAARKLTRGRVIAVFGSAGLRDRQKRRMMAETSAELADFTILTAEDPRTESLDVILGQMAAGVESKGGVERRTFWRIADRREAIRFAVHLAQNGDLVICCGKGHEQSMCFGEIEYPWDDRTALRSALAELLGIPGPEMPHLPTV